jgi:hypothetical protein
LHFSGISLHADFALGFLSGFSLAEQMVAQSIAALKERSGSSRAAIKKWIAANFGAKLQVATFDTLIRQAIARGLKSGSLIQVKGSFKLSEAAKPKKAVKKVAAKKAAAKKPAAAK